MLLQLVVMGLATGCLYGLIALAMVIIYKTSEILNFAQGELAMFSTFFAFALIEGLGLGWAVSLPLTLVFAMLLGATCELVFLRSARKRSRWVPLALLWSFTGFVVVLALIRSEQVPALLAVLVAVFGVWMTAETFSKRPLRKASLLGLIIITLGLEMILYGAAGGIFGTDQQSLTAPVSNLSVHRIGTLVISELDLVIFSSSLALMILLALFFRYTRLGVAMKATSQNETAARLMGIRPWRIFAFTWALAAAVGALAGLMTAASQPIDPNLMMEPLLKGFAAAVLGGMTSLRGAVLGGCILGVLENLVAGYLPDGTQFKSTVAFLVIVLVLCIKPSGLLGHHFVRKV